jgi:SP family general alpha glucoside:H+ symporter-like MFS transporter
MQPRTSKQNEATKKEHDLSVKAAVNLYAKAIIFSLIFSFAVIMEGYYTSLIGTFFGFTPFLDRYGGQFDPQSPGSRIVSERWQSIITIGAQVSSPSGFFPLLCLQANIDTRYLGW